MKFVIFNGSPAGKNSATSPCGTPPQGRRYCVSVLMDGYDIKRIEKSVHQPPLFSASTRYRRIWNPSTESKKTAGKIKRNGQKCVYDIRFWHHFFNLVYFDGILRNNVFHISPTRQNLLLWVFHGFGLKTVHRSNTGYRREKRKLVCVPEKQICAWLSFFSAIDSICKFKPFGKLYTFINLLIKYFDFFLNADYNRSCLA